MLGSFQPESIKAIFFDVDGTLRDTDDQYVARFRRWLRPLRLVTGEAGVTRLARRMVMHLEKPGNDALSLADRLGLDGPIARLAESIARRRPPRPVEAHLVPGVAAAMERLVPRFQLAVITVRNQRATQAFLQASGLSAHIRLAVSGQTTPRTKPAADPVLYACRYFDLPPQECLVVGDTTPDILAAKAAGAQAAGVLSGFGEEDELRHAGADFILPSVAELPAALGIG